jgi:translation initiation factor 1 (eIF-1/SUI1)
MEKKRRGGKTVTVVDGLPQNAAFLKDLCQNLKPACGTGGTASTARSNSRVISVSVCEDPC